MSLVSTSVPFHVAGGRSDMGDIRLYICNGLRKKGIEFHDTEFQEGIPNYENRTRYEIRLYIVTTKAGDVTYSRSDIDHVIDTIGNDACIRGLTIVYGDFDISDNKRVEMRIYL